MKIRTEGINELYHRALNQLMFNPDFICSPRGLKINECLNAQLVLTNPRRRIISLKGRNLSKKYLAGEFCFYMSGSNRLDFIAFYSEFWKKVSDDGITINSCYGKKLFFDLNKYSLTQFGYAKEQLLKDSDTRKAIMTIYTRENTRLYSKDNPCTISLQFFIREDKLFLTTYMRSNDIWLGTPYDIAFFTIVQELMLVKLKSIKYFDLKLGSYTHFIGSLHLYEKQFLNVINMQEDMSSNYLIESECMPIMTNLTWKELEDLLIYEKQIRLHGPTNFLNRLIDPFLKRILGWLI
ncbi:hypothetical protein LCGC14_0521410 [marine sediment metagenome]|uniref:Thymidylate synthase/dCMP hydroxymethylase domain-containing protein n=1 Tax=marine sediment metagenome TaxID=412755 RepID=A0A0F9UJU3_9ZZZZ